MHKITYFQIFLCFSFFRHKNIEAENFQSFPPQQLTISRFSTPTIDNQPLFLQSFVKFRFDPETFLVPKLLILHFFLISIVDLLFQFVQQLLVLSLKLVNLQIDWQS